MENIYSDDSIIVDKTKDEVWFHLRIINNLCELGFPKEEWINFIESMTNLIAENNTEEV